MVTVGELQVLLEARTREFQEGLRAAERRLDRFERGTNRTVERTRNRFLGLRGAIVGVASALGAIVAVRALAGLVAQSIRAASSFEQFEVQLQNFLGTQEEANLAVRNFTELAARTPFAVGEVVQAGTILGGVALGNREALEELTQTAINLAAVTGISLPEAAGNLQRSLTAGIASADLFRERGVRRLIEAVASIPDLTAEPLERQRELFNEVFGPEGVFGSAAENLSFTLGGALSNVSDALERVQASLGAAFAPAVVGGLREFLIPLLDRLRVLIENNSDEIRDFAFNAVRAAVRFIGFLAQGIAGTARALATFQRLIRTARANLNGLTLSFVQFLNRINQIPEPLRRAGEVASDSFRLLSRLARNVTDETVASLQSLQEELEAQAGERLLLDDVADGAQIAADEVSRLAAEFQNINAADFAKAQREAASASDELAAALKRAAAQEAVDPKTAKQAEQALRQVERAVDRIRLANVRAAEPLRAQLDVLDQQIQKSQALERTRENQARIEASLLALQQERARIADQLTGATVQQARAQSDVQGLLGELALFDRAQAAELEEDFARAFEGARGTEARARVAEDFARRIKDAIDEIRPELPALNEAIAGTFTQNLRSTLDGESVNFAESIGMLLEQRATESLNRAFEDSLAAFEQSFSKILEGAGKTLAGLLSEDGALSGLGDTLGGILGKESLISGALGVGAAIVRGLGREVETSSTAANVRSAITSTQAVRGIVAGPTQIAVAQIGPAISDAFTETNEILRDQLAVQNLIERNTRGEGMSDVERATFQRSTT